MKNKIIEYIVNQYEPHTIILYGSYADGSNNTNSDFDALVITDKKCTTHDGNELDGILLDVFIYNTSEFNNKIDYKKYVKYMTEILFLINENLEKNFRIMYVNISKICQPNLMKKNSMKLNGVRKCFFVQVEGM